MERKSGDNFTYDALERRTGQPNAAVSLTYTYEKMLKFSLTLLMSMLAYTFGAWLATLVTTGSLASFAVWSSFLALIGWATAKFVELVIDDGFTFLNRYPKYDRMTFRYAWLVRILTVALWAGVAARAMVTRNTMLGVSSTIVFGVILWLMSSQVRIDEDVLSVSLAGRRARSANLDNVKVESGTFGLTLRVYSLIEPFVQLFILPLTTQAADGALKQVELRCGPIRWLRWSSGARRALRILALAGLVILITFVCLGVLHRAAVLGD